MLIEVSPLRVITSTIIRNGPEGSQKEDLDHFRTETYSLLSPKQLPETVESLHFFFNLRSTHYHLHYLQGKLKG